MKRQPTEWEKIFANDVINKGLISEFIKNSTDKREALPNGRVRTSKIHSSRKILTLEKTVKINFFRPLEINQRLETVC